MHFREQPTTPPARNVDPPGATRPITDVSETPYIDLPTTKPASDLSSDPLSRETAAAVTARVFPLAWDAVAWDSVPWRSFKKIIVTGPQKSGTTFFAKALAEHLGYIHVDETFTGAAAFNTTWKQPIDDDWVRRHTSLNLVFQQPGWVPFLHKLPRSSEIFVAYVARNCLDVFRSQNKVGNGRHDNAGWTCLFGRRIEWQRMMQQTDPKLRKAVDSERDMICTIKQQAYRNFQREEMRRRGVATAAIAYSSFRTLDSFVGSSKARSRFGVKQTSTPSSLMRSPSQSVPSAPIQRFKSPPAKGAPTRPSLMTGHRIDVAVCLIGQFMRDAQFSQPIKRILGGEADGPTPVFDAFVESSTQHFAGDATHPVDAPKLCAGLGALGFRGCTATLQPYDPRYFFEATRRRHCVVTAGERSAHGFGCFPMYPHRTASLLHTASRCTRSIQEAEREQHAPRYDFVVMTRYDVLGHVAVNAKAGFSWRAASRYDILGGRCSDACETYKEPPEKQCASLENSWVGPSARCSFAADTDYRPDKVLAAAKAASPSECCTQCAATPECKVGIWSRPSNTCFLKEDGQDLTAYSRKGRVACVKRNSSAPPRSNRARGAAQASGATAAGPHCDEWAKNTMWGALKNGRSLALACTTEWAQMHCAKLCCLSKAKASKAKAGPRYETSCRDQVIEDRFLLGTRDAMIQLEGVYDHYITGRKSAERSFPEAVMRGFIIELNRRSMRVGCVGQNFTIDMPTAAGGIGSPVGASTTWTQAHVNATVRELGLDAAELAEMIQSHAKHRTLPLRCHPWLQPLAGLPASSSVCDSRTQGDVERKVPGKKPVADRRLSPEKVYERMHACTSQRA